MPPIRRLLFRHRTPVILVFIFTCLSFLYTLPNPQLQGSEIVIDNEQHPDSTSPSPQPQGSEIVVENEPDPNSTLLNPQPHGSELNIDPEQNSDSSQTIDSLHTYTTYERAHDLTIFPPEYNDPPKGSAMCQAAFGFDYLHKFSMSATEYCSTDSESQITCFHNSIDRRRIDSFCIGGVKSFDTNATRFVLDCKLKDSPTAALSVKVPPLRGLHRYWYGTGPWYISNKYIKIVNQTNSAYQPPKERPILSILIKREGVGTNLWHSLMEIMSTFLTIDALRMTIDPKTSTPVLQPKDFDTTEIIILDNADDGPYFDLWSTFAHLPVRRISELDASFNSTPRNILLPLPGGSNPFWQGDWALLNCTSAPLLSGFSKRVLDFYKVPKPLKSTRDPIVMTYIKRTNKRRLIDQDHYLDLIQQQLGHMMDIIVVDFATISFRDQLRIARETDILVGVHGAGLTHSIFLPPHSVVVEILPFELHHKGFHNVAMMLGHEYIEGRAANISNATSEKVDWHDADISMGYGNFTSLIEEAVYTAKRFRSGIK